jgi:FtsZ-binding cell division protein ZapB
MLQIDMRKRIYSSDSERQKAYRLRKEEKGGRFVRVFVPKEIESRIKGNPRLLVERFIAAEKLQEQSDKLQENKVAIERLKDNSESLIKNIKAHTKINDKLRQENHDLQNMVKALERRIENEG